MERGEKRRGEWIQDRRERRERRGERIEERREEREERREESGYKRGERREERREERGERRGDRRERRDERRKGRRVTRLHSGSWLLYLVHSGLEHSQRVAYTWCKRIEMHDAKQHSPHYELRP